MDLYVVGEHRDGEGDVAEQHNAAAPNRWTSQRRRQPHRPIFAGKGHLSQASKLHVFFVLEILTVLCETSIFAYLGLFIFDARWYAWNPYHSIIAIVGCCLSRAIMIPSLSFAANWITNIRQMRNKVQPGLQRLPSIWQPGVDREHHGVQIDCKMQFVLWFAGLRGAMSFALVEHIPMYDASNGEGTRLKAELKAMTCASIFFTVFILGGCTYYVVEMLGLAPSPSTTTKSPPQKPKTLEMVGLLSKGSQDDEFEVVSKDSVPSEGFGQGEQLSAQKIVGVRQRLLH